MYHKIIVAEKNTHPTLHHCIAQHLYEILDELHIIGVHIG